MCTAISFKTKDHYFGRTLDLEYHYNESVVVTPRNFPFSFSDKSESNSHPALIGIATVIDSYPLYYEATNESGLSMAGLNFPGNAVFFPIDENKKNIAPFEFIPFILTQCKNVDEAKTLLKNINLADIDFRPDLKTSPLHWIISDKSESITVESVRDGLKIYDNPIGVLTNNPPFDRQMTNLANYINLTAEEPKNTFAPSEKICTFSKGMGAVGLPGDLTSASRFVRAAFTKSNSVCGDSEDESVSQFFHILGAVEQQRGCVRLPDGRNEITVYTSCCNTDRGIYYYTTYENSRITAVELDREDLDGNCAVVYPLERKQQIHVQNK